MFVRHSVASMGNLAVARAIALANLRHRALVSRCDLDAGAPATKRGVFPLRSTVLAADGLQGRKLRSDAHGQAI